MRCLLICLDFLSRKCTLEKVFIFYSFLNNTYLLAVTPGSENQKDAQRSCDQFSGSSASRWLF